MGVIINAIRPREIIATCPACGTERSLPLNWQDIMRASLPMQEQQSWDGQLRCKQPHGPGIGPVVMITREVDNTSLYPPAPEADGTYLAHLADDRNRKLAACTRELLWNSNLIPRGSIIRQCPACFNLYLHGGYKEP